MRPVGEAEGLGTPGWSLIGPHARVQVERASQRDLGRDLGAVREADVGEPGRAEEDGVDRPAQIERLAGELLAGAAVAGGPASASSNEKRQPARWARLEDPHRLGQTTSGPMPSPPSWPRCGSAARQARAAARSRLLAISAATRIASTMLSGLAMPASRAVEGGAVVHRHPEDGQPDGHVDAGQPRPGAFLASS